MSGDNSDRIIVAKDNLARCQWCGTPESPFWTISKTEKIYCTHECMAAAESTNKRIYGIMMICCGLLFGIPFVFFLISMPVFSSVGSSTFLIPFGMCIILTGLFSYFEGKEGLQYKERKDKYRGVAPVVCTYCSHQNSPSQKACQNCGASLSGAPFSMESTPPWFRKGGVSGVYKCPHCSAVYSYRQAPISAEGMVTCQNCTRSFRPSKPSQVEPQSRHYY